jgi:hypothetical protein
MMAWTGAFLNLESTVTNNQLHALFGQGVHAASSTVVARRLLARVAPGQRQHLRTYGALGAGVNLFGLIMGAVLGATCKWWAEGCGIARRANEAIQSFTGQKAAWFARAESVPTGADMKVGLELLTLRCAPWSPKSRNFPQGCWAAIAELLAVMEGIKARSPRAIVVENTAGLWRHDIWRERVESCLLTCEEYEWEAVITSPHVHSAVPVIRWRVFYIGVRRDTLNRGRAM